MPAIASQRKTAMSFSTVQAGRRVHFKSILALATVCRLGIVWMMLTQFPKSRLFNQAMDLGFLARSLDLGRGFSSPFGGSTGPTALITPGYPAVIALIFHFLGPYSFASAVAVMVLQTLFSILTIAVMLYVTRKLFGAQTANLAGFFYALSVPLFWIPAIFWYTALSALFLVGMIALALWAVEHPAMKSWLLIGTYCGIVMWIDPSLVLAMVAIFTWAACHSRLSSCYLPWICLAVMLIIFAPWPVRNARVMHAFIPLRSSFGYELWQGNRSGADGVFDDALYPTHDQSEYANYAAKGEMAYMHEKSILAENYIRSHPGEFARLTIKRMARFWAGIGYEVNSNLIRSHVLATSLLGLIGLATLFKRRKAVAMLFLLPILLFPLPYYITDIKFRYRMEIDPIMAMLAAYMVTRLYNLLKPGGETNLSSHLRKGGKSHES